MNARTRTGIQVSDLRPGMFATSPAAPPATVLNLSLHAPVMVS